MEDNYINFYPTPVSLIEKMVQGIDFRVITDILEPEAGKGDIVDYLKKNERALGEYGHEFNVDCIEIVPDLRAALKGKEYHVVGDDFLKHETYKHYDLIIMNPPFDEGASHLLKALRMQENGGTVVCLLNAETLRNPCDNKRRELTRLLEQYDAKIEYLSQEFKSAERTTSVEIAMVKVTVPERTYGNSIFFNEMRKSVLQREMPESDNLTDVAVNDFIKSAVQRFEIEVAAGLKLIREYKEISPYILRSIKKDDFCNKPILQLKVGDGDLSENKFLKRVRHKYWSALFNDERFTKGMPSDIRSGYSEKVNELSEYDFSYFNIKEIQIQMKQSLIDGIEESIMNLFHELTDKHTWGEFSQNIHYYNGWATNKAWYVGRKVILPAYDVFSDIWKKFKYRYDVTNKLRDIEKALDYLNGTPGRDSFLSSFLMAAEEEQKSRNIETAYFTVTFYKKGTMHIVFKDEELIKRLNIFAGRRLNMLPPCYGKKAYDEMTREEKDVIDSFEGKESYQQVYSHQEKYLYEVGNGMIGLIEDKIA